MNYDMSRPVDICNAQRKDDWVDILNDLRRWDYTFEGAGRAARMFEGLVNSPPGQRAGVFATAAGYLDPYASREALRSQEFPNANDHAFVRGDPEGVTGLWLPGDPTLAANGIYPRLKGRADTLYITGANAENNTTPIIIDRIEAIRRAAGEYAKEYEEDV